MNDASLWARIVADALAAANKAIATFTPDVAAVSAVPGAERKDAFVARARLQRYGVTFSIGNINRAEPSQTVEKIACQLEYAVRHWLIKTFNGLPVGALDSEIPAMECHVDHYYEASFLWRFLPRFAYKTSTSSGGTTAAAADEKKPTSGEAGASIAAGTVYDDSAAYAASKNKAFDDWCALLDRVDANARVTSGVITSDGGDVKS